MRENKFQMFELTEILPAGWLKEATKDSGKWIIRGSL